MYRIQCSDRVPKPRVATTPYIVAAHYYPAWKKATAGLHRGFDDLAAFPERTPLFGYYDGDDPNYQNWEIKWALEHGINCFIYCWYRKKENEGQPLTVQDLRLGETLHDGFFQATYRDQMQFAIMYEASLRWGGTDRNDLLTHLMPFWLENYFSKPNYLKIDNKPVLFIYDYQNQVRDAFASLKEQRETFDLCREMAKKHGHDGMIFAIEYRKEDLSRLAEYREAGYDFSFAYCWSIKQPNPTDEWLIETQLKNMELRRKDFSDFYVPTASVMWDPSPRFVSMPQMYTPQNNPSLWQLRPESFRELLSKTRQWMQALPENSYGSRMLMLDNWNEWDEGHFLLPSVKYGFSYLQAVREEITERDNLPDYRSPELFGRAGEYNHEWGSPDFSEAILKDCE